MRGADLKVGDRVWVVRPYEGGTGWCEIVRFGGTPGTVILRPESGSSLCSSTWYLWKDTPDRTFEGSTRWIVKRDVTV